MEKAEMYEVEMRVVWADGREDSYFTYGATPDRADSFLSQWKIAVIHARGKMLSHSTTLMPERVKP